MRLASSAARSRSSAAIFSIAGPVIRDTGPDTEIAAEDKTLEFIKADHYLTEPAGARAQAADLIATWVTSHGG